MSEGKINIPSSKAFSKQPEMWVSPDLRVSCISALVPKETQVLNFNNLEVSLWVLDDKYHANIDSWVFTGVFQKPCQISFSMFGYG